MVASLWDVDDRGAAVLFESFHRALLEGNPPAEALRKAQTRLRRSTDPELASPSVWAAFQVFGWG